MNRIAALILSLGLLCCVPTGASAQADFMSMFQGPWNVNAQSAKKVSKRYHSTGRQIRAAFGMPPRNARCGWFMGRLTGHTDRDLWLAQNWARKFPRTTASPGAVVVWTRGGRSGHVAKIVSMTSACRAVVTDNAGTYERDICRRVIAYVRV